MNQLIVLIEKHEVLVLHHLLHQQAIADLQLVMLKTSLVRPVFAYLAWLF